MRLDAMTAVIRPRRPWEAVDLGLLLTRRSARTIYGAWACTLLPFYLALFTLCWDMLWLAALVHWWLKPVFDRMVLHVLSRALFGAEPTVGETLRALPGVLGRSHLLWCLTLGRFDLARSYSLPVWQLEGLSGTARRQRMRVLNRQDRGTGVWLTFLGIHFEYLLLGSLAFFIYLLVPEQLQSGLLERLFESDDWEGLINGLVTLLMVPVVALVEPFYVGAGFALYLNRRTHLEGWDLELAMRRLANRLAPPPAAPSTSRAAAWIAAGLLALGVAQTGTAQAGVDAAEAKARIEKVLAAEEFQQYETREEWRHKDSLKKPLDEATPELREGPAFVGPLLEGLVWAAGAGLVLWLLLSYRRWIGYFKRGPRAAKAAPPAPEVVLGMDIRPEKLPEHPGQAALALWRRGEAAAALSLLYRGALGVLVHRRGLALGAGATEGDCLRAVHDQTSGTLPEYFRRLTLAWQSVAYAHRRPTDAEVEGLCSGWDSHFGAGR